MLAAGLALCTCGALAIPDSGSTDVPVDVNPLVQVGPYGEEPDIRLEDAEGGIVEADLDIHEQGARTWLSVAPAAELSPQTEHVLRYYVDGSPDYTPPFFRFTTGQDATQVELQTPALEGLSAGIQPFHGNCYDSCYAAEGRRFVRIDYEPDPDAVYYELTFGSGDGAVTRFLPGGSSTLSNSACNIEPPHLSAGAELCLQMRAVAIDGSRSAPSAELCTEVAACASVDPCEQGFEADCLDPGGADAGVELIDPPDDRGGCSASRSSPLGWLMLVLLVHHFRRRRS